MNRSESQSWQRMRAFMRGESAGGLALMGAAALALVVAQSALAPQYFAVLALPLGPLSLLHWINDGLMAVFFLLVGLEIKREMLHGELATWPQRALPGIAALGGMLLPAIAFAALNRHDALALRGWAVPTATDIAFALGVMSLLGSRVPASLKVFLTALAIIDDLGAVIIIAIFYTQSLAWPDLAAALVVLGALALLGRLRIASLWPYLLLGVVLWVFVLRSGVHATLAGVALALVVPAGNRNADRPSNVGLEPPLQRLEHALRRVVPLLVLPLFGFANAGVSLAGIDANVLAAPVTLGVAFGLVFGKLIGVAGFGALAVRLRLARLPADANGLQFLGVALLCGIGFTMSLFIALLAYAEHPVLLEQAKLGILSGSLVAALAGTVMLRFAAPRPRS